MLFRWLRRKTYKRCILWRTSKSWPRTTAISSEKRSSWFGTKDRWRALSIAFSPRAGDTRTKSIWSGTLTWIWQKVSTKTRIWWWSCSIWTCVRSKSAMCEKSTIRESTNSSSGSTIMKNNWESQREDLTKKSSKFSKRKNRANSNSNYWTFNIKMNWIGSRMSCKEWRKPSLYKKAISSTRRFSWKRSY